MKWRALLLVTALVLAGLLGLWLALPKAGVTRANYDRIGPGMNQAEVEALLGGPAGDRRSAAQREADLCDNREWLYEDYPAAGRWAAHQEWHTDDASVTIDFDAAGGVFSKAFRPTDSDPARTCAQAAGRLFRQLLDR